MRALKENASIAAEPAGATAAALNLHTPDQFAVAYAGRACDAYTPLLAQIVRDGTPGAIVDLGAGLGLFVELAASWGIDAIGIEGSDYAVSEAKRRSPDLRMIVHDIGEPLPLATDSTANVMLNQVIEHVDRARAGRVLREAHRILRPGGTLFVNSPSRRNRKERREATHINLLLPSELDRMLRGAGFRVIARPDYGLWFAPDAPATLDRVGSMLLRFVPHDWLSGSANAVARK